ncbi:MAG: biopolymer transporter ExbD [Pontiellaceae bacterium]|jgi:biopolymer transport protein ExbD|nr:biopolymer transporter ExbD [Pontiellaceae bacterium]
MRKKRREREEPAIEVSMTPMIDVVFQLLIYFLVTFSTPDVLAHLDISRPAPDKSQTEQRTPPKMIRVNIYENGFSLNGRSVQIEELASILGRLAEFSKNQTVLITCAGGSEHARLISVLDLCAQTGLSKISVMSAN